MRGHFEYELFNTPFPPHFGSWGRGFGPGPVRPPFGMSGWPDFDRHGCRSHGPPGFDHSPDHHGRPHHESDHHGACSAPEDGGQEEHHGPSHEHGSPRCRRKSSRGPCNRGRSGCRQQGVSDDEQDHDGSSRCRRRNTAEGHHGSPGCRRDKSSENRCECRHHDHGPWDRSPRCGPPRRGHHHGFGPGRHGFGLGYHGFGPCSRGFFEWPGFGPDCRRPHFGPWFRHERPGPYDRGCSPTRDCRNRQGRPCCSKNKENDTSDAAGRKDNGLCGARNKDQDATGNTVLVQRIIVEKAPTRPLSV